MDQGGPAMCPERSVALTEKVRRVDRYDTILKPNGLF